MWTAQILLAVIGLSAGIAVAGGLFSFIIGLGVISKFADRTHTGDNVLLYEEFIALGGILGNIMYFVKPEIGGGPFALAFFGIFAGVFVGCWSMALAEILNIFPIFIRRVKLLKCIPYIILSMAVGKGLGAMLFFANRW